MIEIQQQSLFDYDSLDEPTRLFVQERAERITARTKRCIAENGQDLLDVKSRLTHGQFLSWIRYEWDWSEDTAENQMNVARCAIGNPKISEFAQSAQYLLSRPSNRDALQEAIQRHDTGEKITYTVARDIVETHKPIPSPIDKPLAPNPGVDEEKSEMRIETPVKSPALTALQSSDSNEWYTPAEYIEAARELMGAIDIDPASCEEANHIVKATKFYAKQDNGLMQSWAGRVWLNPPYGMDCGISNQEIWAHQLIERYKAGLTSEAVLLVNANTEAKWFQPLYDYLICLTNHRIRFYNTYGDSSQPTQGNALVYFGSQKRRFIELFRCFGRVIREAKADEY